MLPAIQGWGCLGFASTWLSNAGDRRPQCDDVPRGANRRRARSCSSFKMTTMMLLLLCGGMLGKSAPAILALCAVKCGGLGGILEAGTSEKGRRQPAERCEPPPAP